MEIDPGDPPLEALDFLSERHLATLTTLRADGSPQVTPVGLTYEPECRLGRVITRAGSFKARTIARHPGQRVALCQVDGARWLSLYGTAIVSSERRRVAGAERRYAQRYRPPTERSDRVVIEITVDRMVGRL
ncbi:MAG: pyridoxamine 5'-phosphate oxidase family protein [Acidimicrobiales bacterium]